MIRSAHRKNNRKFVVSNIVLFIGDIFTSYSIIVVMLIPFNAAPHVVLHLYVTNHSNASG